MVKTVHRQSHMSKNASRSVSELLKMRSEFLDLTPYLTQETKRAIADRTTVLPQPRGNMPHELRRVLKDIDNLEQTWGLRDRETGTRIPPDGN